MSKNIALVLSGGGARGIAHIGVINVLKKYGFKINAISGTSMGALVGGVYCCNQLNELQNWLENANIQQAIKILDYSFSDPGFIKGDKLMKKINTFLLIDEIEQLPIPFTANATNMTNDEEVVFRYGNLSHAIRSSISIPSVFTPVIDGEKVIVDGGLLNNIPINRVQKSKDDLVFAVNVNSSIPISKDYQSIMFKDKKSENIYLDKIDKIRSHFETFIKYKTKTNNKISQYELIDQSIHMLISEVSKNIIKSNPPDVLIEIPRQICGTFDFLKAEQIIKVGELATEKKLKELRLI